MAFEIELGALGSPHQKIMVNLTSSFDGLALPSHVVSKVPGTYYNPLKSNSMKD